MRRRLITLVTAGLLAVGGFTAAALASGGNPLGLLDDQGTSTAQTTGPLTTIGQPSTEESTERESTDEESTDEESANAKETTEQTTTETEAESAPTAATEHKVTICHHTGSANHPFHEISVDEHALDAHTGHGDTVGPCPATAPTQASTTVHNAKPPKRKPRNERHAKPEHDHGVHGGSHKPHGNGGHGSGHGHGNGSHHGGE
jgi:hypothetical protein